MSKPTYRPDLDGLRAVALIQALFYHGHLPGFSGGFVGLDIFFVISGFLITEIVWRDACLGQLSLADFYERRARRILPALILVVALSTVAAWFILTPPALEEFGGHVVATNFFVVNIVYWLQTGYFSTKAEFLPLFHIWSLSVEEQFYALYPLLLMLLAKARPKFAGGVLGALTLASFAAAVVLTRTSVHASAAYFLLPTRAWELFVGGLLALLGVARRERLHAHPLAQPLAYVGLVICACAVFLFRPSTPHPGPMALLPIAGTCLLILFSDAKRGAGRVLALPPVLYLGLMSYSVYLIHQPVLVFARLWLARELTMTESIACITVAIGAGALSWQFVERPFRARGVIGGRAALGLALTTSVLLVVAGALFMVGDGYPARSDARINAVIAEIREGAPTRLAGIRIHECHWNSDTPDFSKFLQGWSCLPTGEVPKILVVGDSIAADKSWVLREAHVPVGNLTGAGCTVLPPPNPAEPCAQIIRKARQLVADGKVSGVILAQNWLEPLTVPELGAIIDYWQEPDVPILLFSGMPNFKDLRQRIPVVVRNGESFDSIHYDEVAFDAHWRSLQRLRECAVSVLNSRDLLCGRGNTRCRAYDGEFLLLDATHVRLPGAKRMAENLLKDPIWQAWYLSLKPPLGGAAPRAAAGAIREPCLSVLDQSADDMAGLEE